MPLLRPPPQMLNAALAAAQAADAKRAAAADPARAASQRSASRPSSAAPALSAAGRGGEASSSPKGPPGSRPPAPRFSTLAALDDPEAPDDYPHFLGAYITESRAPARLAWLQGPPSTPPSSRADARSESAASLLSPPAAAAAAAEARTPPSRRKRLASAGPSRTTLGAARVYGGSPLAQRSPKPRRSRYREAQEAAARAEAGTPPASSNDEDEGEGPAAAAGSALDAARRLNAATFSPLVPPPPPRPPRRHRSRSPDRSPRGPPKDRTPSPPRLENRRATVLLFDPSSRPGLGYGPMALGAPVPPEELRPTLEKALRRPASPLRRAVNRSLPEFRATARGDPLLKIVRRLRALRTGVSRCAYSDFCPTCAIDADHQLHQLAAAILIETAGRRFLARRERAREARQRSLEARAHVVVRYQLTRSAAATLFGLLASWRAHRARCATAIQAVARRRAVCRIHRILWRYRSYLACLMYVRWRNRTHRRKRSARSIERAWNASRYRRSVTGQFYLRTAAATAIQAVFRRRLARPEARLRLGEYLLAKWRREIIASAIRIQAVWRRKLVRRWVAKRILLGRYYARRWRGRSRVAQLQRVVRAVMELQRAAAVVVQAVVRRMRARGRLERLRRDSAATVIGAVARRRLSKRLVAERQRLSAAFRRLRRAAATELAAVRFRRLLEARRARQRARALAIIRRAVLAYVARRRFRLQKAARIRREAVACIRATALAGSALRHADRRRAAVRTIQRRLRLWHGQRAKATLKINARKRMDWLVSQGMTELARVVRSTALFTSYIEMSRVLESLYSHRRALRLVFIYYCMQGAADFVSKAFVLRPARAVRLLEECGLVAPARTEEPRAALAPAASFGRPAAKLSPAFRGVPRDALQLLLVSVARGPLVEDGAPPVAPPPRPGSGKGRRARGAPPRSRSAFSPSSLTDVSEGEPLATAASVPAASSPAAAAKPPAPRSSSLGSGRSAHALAAASAAAGAAVAGSSSEDEHATGLTMAEFADALVRLSVAAFPDLPDLRPGQSPLALRVEGLCLAFLEPLAARCESELLPPRGAPLLSRLMREALAPFDTELRRAFRQSAPRASGSSFFSYPPPPRCPGLTGGRAAPPAPLNAGAGPPSRPGSASRIASLSGPSVGLLPFVQFAKASGVVGSAVSVFTAMRAFVKANGERLRSFVEEEGSADALLDYLAADYEHFVEAVCRCGEAAVAAAGRPGAQEAAPPKPLTERALADFLARVLRVAR